MQLNFGSLHLFGPNTNSIVSKRQGSQVQIHKLIHIVYLKKKKITFKYEIFTLSLFNMQSLICFCLIASTSSGNVMFPSTAPTIVTDPKMYTFWVRQHIWYPNMSFISIKINNSDRFFLPTLLLVPLLCNSGCISV